MATVISFKKVAPATSAPQPAPKPSPVIEVKATPVVDTQPKPSPVVDTQPSGKLVVPPSQQVATISDELYNGVGQFEGEFDAGDFRIPYLGICGPSSESFKADPSLLGQFILNKTVPLSDAIRVTFVRVKKWWTEELPYDPNSKVIPQRFSFMADARAAGFNESQLKATADLDLAIEVPADSEGIEELTDIFVGGKAYLLARYSVQSSAYGKTIPVLRADQNGFLKGNLLNGHYMMTTAKGAGKNLYFYPTLKTDGPTSIELRNTLCRRLASVSTPNAAAA